MKTRALLLCFLVAGACTIQARDVLQASLTAAAPAALEPASTAGPAKAPAVAAATTTAEPPAAAAAVEPTAGAAAAAATPGASPAAPAAGAGAAADATEAPAAAVGTAATTGPGPAKAAAAQLPAAAAAAPAKPAAKEPDSWVQKDGFVPVPRAAPTEAANGTAAAAPAEAPALPPANAWAIPDDTPEQPQPANVADVYADPRTAPKPAGDSASTSAQSALGGDMPTGGTLGSAAAPSTDVFAPSTDVFAAGSSNELPNTYKPSPMNALGANDLLAKMTLDNDQQELVGAADFVRQKFANVTSTLPSNVFWYQTRTTQAAGGKAQVQASLLFKNTGSVDRSRQRQALLNPDYIAGISRDVAKYNIKIVPGSVTTSSAVNDAGDSGMMPGAMGGLGLNSTGFGMGLPGMNGTGLGLPGFGMGGLNSTAAAAPAPPPPPKAAAGAVVVGLLLPAVMAVAAVML